MLRSMILTLSLAMSLTSAKACVKDPAPNETTCGHEARMIVSRRHGFSDMAHANMVEAIAASPKLNKESDIAYKACMARNHFCPPPPAVPVLDVVHCPDFIGPNPGLTRHQQVENCDSRIEALKECWKCEGWSCRPR